LRSRFGRAWRRKAPVESLMPLRLARYGVPLAETAAAGLASAGIDKPPIQFAFEQPSASITPQKPELEASVTQEKEQSQESTTAPHPVHQAREVHREQSRDAGKEGNKQHLADAYQDWLAAFGLDPTPEQFALWLQEQHGIATAAGGPLPNEQLKPLLRLLERHSSTGTRPTSQAPNDTDDGWGDYFYNAWLTYADEYGTYPDAAALAGYAYERDRITGTNGQPIVGDDLETLVSAFQRREFGEVEPPFGVEGRHLAAQGSAEDRLPNHARDDEASVDAVAHPASELRIPRVSAALDDPPTEDDDSYLVPSLTTVDRYYLAWTDYQTENGEEPKAEQFSAYLASKKGMNGRGGKPVSPSTLRRYLLPFRVYSLWAAHRIRSDAPLPESIAQECAAQGITAQHNKPLAPEYIAEQVADFERRWQALTRHHAHDQS
ncbi:hypothetical protein ACFV2Z_31680, partial [Streptomyces sp. NPDC059688]